MLNCLEERRQFWRVCFPFVWLPEDFRKEKAFRRSAVRRFAAVFRLHDAQDVFRLRIALPHMDQIACQPTDHFVKETFTDGDNIQKSVLFNKFETI